MSNCPECDKVLYSSSLWCKCGWKRSEKPGEAKIPDALSGWGRKLSALKADLAHWRQMLELAASQPANVLDVYKSEVLKTDEKIKTHLLEKPYGEGEQWGLQA